jgi:hypothetical protein
MLLYVRDVVDRLDQGKIRNGGAFWEVRVIWIKIKSPTDVSAFAVRSLDGARPATTQAVAL